MMGNVIVYRYQHNIFNKLICLKCLGLKIKVVFPPYFGWNYVAHNCIILTPKKQQQKMQKELYNLVVFLAQCRLASTYIRNVLVKLIE